MRILLSSLLALSFLAGMAGASSATVSTVNGKKVFDRLDKEGRGGHHN